METQYSIKGFYSPRMQIARCNFSGEITIDSNGIIKGDCTDLEALVREQTIIGQIEILKGKGLVGTDLAKIAFMKHPKNEKSTNIIYRLSCSIPDFNGDYSGKYRGEWDELSRPHVIGRKIDLLKIPFLSLGYGNYAEITLTKK